MRVCQFRHFGLRSARQTRRGDGNYFSIILAGRGEIAKIAGIAKIEKPDLQQGLQ